MPQLANIEHPTDATAITHVPRRGFGLTGYALTDVTQTVDRLVSTRFGLDWLTDQAQTIRFYGEAVPIPEPTTWLLLATAALACIRKNT